MRLLNILTIILSLINFIFCQNFCYTPGLACTNDCSSVILCGPDSSGILRPSTITNCTNLGLECNPRTKDCSQPIGSCPYCSDQKLVCPNNGNLPNPNPCNCQQYYTCLDSGNISRHICDNGNIFDPFTNRCSLKWDPAMCSAVLPPRCLKPGQTAMYPRSSYRYYICTSTPRGDLTHEIYECPMDQRWDPILKKCVDLDNSTPPKNEGFKCLHAGKFTDEKNCRSYYECDNFLKATHRNCFPLKYFNENRKRCMLGFC